MTVSNSDGHSRLHSILYMEKGCSLNAHPFPGGGVLPPPFHEPGLLSLPDGIQILLHIPVQHQLCIGIWCIFRSGSHACTGFQPHPLGEIATPSRWGATLCTHSRNHGYRGSVTYSSSSISGSPWTRNSASRSSGGIELYHSLNSRSNRRAEIKSIG